MRQAAGFQASGENDGAGTPRPFSLRLSETEREFLQAQAGNQPLGTYVRSRLLGENAEPRRRRYQPIKDHERLAYVLAMLGQSHLASNLNRLAKATETGSLKVTLEVVQELLEACQNIRDMREALLSGLGLKREASE